jgi:hypothetical protein
MREPITHIKYDNDEVIKNHFYYDRNQSDQQKLYKLLSQNRDSNPFTYIDHNLYRNHDLVLYHDPNYDPILIHAEYQEPILTDDDLAALSLQLEIRLFEYFPYIFLDICRGVGHFILGFSRFSGIFARYFFVYFGHFLGFLGKLALPLLKGIGILAISLLKH